MCIYLRSQGGMQRFHHGSACEWRSRRPIAVGRDEEGGMQLMACDVSTAFFYALAMRPRVCQRRGRICWTRWCNPMWGIERVNVCQARCRIQFAWALQGASRAHWLQAGQAHALYILPRDEGHQSLHAWRAITLTVGQARQSNERKRMSARSRSWAQTGTTKSNLRSWTEPSHGNIAGHQVLWLMKQAPDSRRPS